MNNNRVLKFIISVMFLAFVVLAASFRLYYLKQKAASLKPLPPLSGYEAKTMGNDVVYTPQNISTTTLPILPPPVKTEKESVVSSTSLVAYYKFDQQSGNPIDSSGNEFTPVTNSITYSSGKINNAAVFNGVSSLITLPIAYPDLTRDWTMSFWIKRASGSGNEAIYSKWTNSSRGRQLLIYFNPNGTIGIDIPYVATVATTTATFTDTSMFHHYVFTKSGITWSIYYDGKLVQSTTNDSPQETSPTLATIGRNSYGDRPFKGAMDEVGIWVRALTPTEITSLYNNGAGLQYPFQVPSTNASTTKGMIAPLNIIPPVTTEPFLELLSPKGEQFLCRGDIKNISWKGSKDLSTVSIYISTVGGSGSGSYPIGSFPASYNESGIKNGEGTYPWKAGYTKSGIELPLNETYQIVMNGCLPYADGSGCRTIFNKNPEPFSFLDCRD